VSDADTMLRYVNPAAKAPDFVTLFTRPGCPHCARAKKALSERGFPYEEIVIGKDVTTRSLRAVTGAGTVPQVFVGGKLIGSADELERWLAKRDAEAA
jgi:glutaredoxin-like protein